MTAELLREAAKALRGRAIGANEGYQPGDEDPWFKVPDANSIRTKWVAFAEAYEAEAPYIATMHPGLGLALADWLDQCATRVEQVWDTIKGQSVRDEATPGIVLGYTEALAVARAILGGAS